MQSLANNVNSYINELPKERVEFINKLRETITKNIPKGFEETMSYGMIGYVVPHSLYPAGYHCDPKPTFTFCISCFAKKLYCPLSYGNLRKSRTFKLVC